MLSFTSFPDLVEKLRYADLEAIHAKMRARNAERHAAALAEWREVAQQIAAGLPRDVPTDYDAAMAALWGAAEMNRTNG